MVGHDLQRHFQSVRYEQNHTKIERSDSIRKGIKNRTAALATSLAVAIGLWAGVKAESVVLTPKVDEADVEASDLVVRQYPAAVDDEPVGNDYAREMFAEDNRLAREAVEAALVREERREKLEAKLVAAQKAHDKEVADKKVAEHHIALAKAIAFEAAKAKAEAAKVAAPEPKPEVKPEPKRERIVVSRSSSEPKAAPIVFEATAYIAMCDTGCTGVTATGLDVRHTIYTEGHRIIAVDPAIIPLGSLVRVNTPSGSFSAIAADTGGHIDGHRVDILMGSTSKAKAFGRQNVSIQILRNGAE